MDDVRPVLNQFSLLLEDISQSITNDELSSLKRQCLASNLMPESTIEAILHPGDLFTELQRKGLVSTGQTELITDLLKVIKREDLIEKLQASVQAYGADKHQKIPFLLQEIAEFLHTFYESALSELQPLPWCHDLFLPLDGVYTNLQFTEKDRRGRSSPQFPLQVKQLIETLLRQSRTPRRVRVEGPPGIGKTTFCRKIVYEWACSRIHQFSLAFLLEMKDFSGNIIDAIFDQLLPEEFQKKFTKTELWDALLENSHDILFVLDGLDEIDPAVLHNSDVMKLIQGKTMYGSTVLVTSRQHEYDAILKNCHPNLKIVGYSPAERNKFIKDYFSGNEIGAEQLIKRIMSNRVISDICQTPLNTILLCILWEENSDKLPETITELYTDLVLAISKNYSTKVLGSEFEGRIIPEAIRKNLITLGRFAWEGIKRNKLIFQQSEIQPKELLLFGFLTKDVSASRIRRSSTCHFLHKTFQEFFASFYLSEMIKDGKGMESELDEVVRKERQTMCVFLSGLHGVPYPSVNTFAEVLTSSGLESGLHDDPCPIFKTFAKVLTSSGLEKAKFERTLNCSLVCLKENRLQEESVGLIASIFPQELLLQGESIFSTVDTAFLESQPEALNLTLCVTEQNVEGIPVVLGHSCCKVHRLICDSGLPPNFTVAILNALPQSSSVRTLDFGSRHNSQATITALSTMITRCQNIEDVSYMHSNPDCDDQIPLFLTEIFKALNRCPPRDKFRMIFNVSTVVYDLPLIPFMELSDMEIPDFEFQYLAQMCVTVNQGLASEIGGLLRVNPKLSKLVVCVSGAHPGSLIDLTPVEEGLEANCSLKCFKLWVLGTLHVMGGPIQCPSTLPVVKALRKNSTLEEISVTVSKAIDLDVIRDVFATNSTLSRLTFWFANDLGEYVPHVLSAVIGHKSINTLCLRYGGPMSSEVLKCLSEVVAHYASVSPLVLKWDSLVPRDVEVSIDSLAALGNAIRKNENVNEVSLPPIKCSETDHPAIFDQIQQIKSYVSNRSCSINIPIVQPVKKEEPPLATVPTMNFYGSDRSKGPVFTKTGEKVEIVEERLEEMSEKERQQIFDFIKMVGATNEIPKHILEKYFS